MPGGVRYDRRVFAKPIYSFLLLLTSLLAWFIASFGGSSSLLVFWPGALALCVPAVLGGFALARGFHGRANFWCVGATLVFFLWILLRGSLTEVKYLARQDLVIAIAAFISYVLVATQLETAKERRWILLTILLILVGNVSWALYQRQSGRNDLLPHSGIASAWPQLGEWLGWATWGRDRTPGDATGFYISENHFAGLVEITALPALGFFLLSRAGVVLRGLALVVYLLGLLGGVLSTSRAGLICLLGGTCVMLGLWWINRLRLGQQSAKKTFITGGILAVLLLGGMIISVPAVARSTRGFVYTQNEVSVRWSYSDIAWKLFNELPLQGHGARAFEPEERRMRDLNVEKWLWYNDVDSDAVFAHNDFAQLLCDYGGVGGLLGGAVLVTHLGAGLAFFWRRSKEQSVAQGADRRDDRLGLTLGAVGAITALMVHSIFDFNLHIAANAMITAILLGMLANPGREALKSLVDETGEPLVPRRGLWLRAPVVTVGVVAAGYLLLHGPDYFKAEKLTVEGKAWAEKEDYYEATAALQRAIEIDPTFFPAYFSMGELNLLEAVHVREFYKPRNAQEKELNSKISQSFLRRACEIFTDAYPHYPQFPYSAMHAATAFSEQRDYTAAEQWFSRAFKYGKSCRRLYFQYGQHLIRQADETGDPTLRLAGRQRALDEFIVPARSKLRSGGEYQKYIDNLIAAINREITTIKSSLQKPADPPPVAPPVAPPSGPTTPGNATEKAP
jgi:tetratricopeptide (TPR) repeat protein